MLIPSPLACLFRPTGNTKTAIIACVTSAQKYVEDTKGTLQFACSVKNIQTSVTVNEILDDQAQLRRLTAACPVRGAVVEILGLALIQPRWAAH